MLRQLSSSHDNGQGMVIYPLSMNPAPLVTSSHDNGQSMVRYHSYMKHAASVVIVS